MLCILQTKELHKIHVENMTSNANRYGTDPYLTKLWNKKIMYSNIYKQNN